MRAMRTYFWSSIQYTLSDDSNLISINVDREMLVNITSSLEEHLQYLVANAEYVEAQEVLTEICDLQKLIREWDSYIEAIKNNDNVSEEQS